VDEDLGGETAAARHRDEGGEEENVDKESLFAYLRTCPSCYSVVRPLFAEARDVVMSRRSSQLLYTITHETLFSLPELLKPLYLVEFSSRKYTPRIGDVAKELGNQQRVHKEMPKIAFFFQFHQSLQGHPGK